MVSGLVTSPELQDRICLDEASPISMASKLFMSINSVPQLCSSNFEPLLVLFEDAFGLARVDVRVEHGVRLRREVFGFELLAGLEIWVLDLGFVRAGLDCLAFVLGRLVRRRAVGGA